MAGDRSTVPLLTELIRQLSAVPQERLVVMVRDYDNERMLRDAVQKIGASGRAVSVMMGLMGIRLNAALS